MYTYNVRVHVFIYILLMCLIQATVCFRSCVRAKCCKYVALFYSLFQPSGIPAVTADL